MRKYQTMHLPGLILLMVLIGSTPATAQEEKEKTGREGTLITSNRFRLDLQKKEGTFTGEVKVEDPGFELVAEELVAYFDASNRVERLVARGKVKMTQGEKRTAEAREAEYIVAEKSLRLTGDPVVTQSGNQITGTVIKIYPGEDRMEVDGRSKVQFFLE
ncbi:MAG: LptA/OstA family protein [Candidatus Methylacidiphilales bacterium]